MSNARDERLSLSALFKQIAGQAIMLPKDLAASDYADAVLISSIGLKYDKRPTILDVI